MGIAGSRMLLKFAAMTVHIGEKIKQRAKELRMGPTELGKKLSTSKQNIYGIYKRKSLNVELLLKLSEALDRDFFLYYQPKVSVNSQEGEAPYGKRSSETIQELKKEIKELRKSNEVLHKYNRLLEWQVEKLEMEIAGKTGKK